MKIRSVVALAALAVSFAFPAFAQEKDVLADPQTTQKVFASFKGRDEAVNNNDAAAVAALYAEDAVFVTDKGPVYGRQAIEKWYADVFKAFRPKNYAASVDGNALHLTGTAGNEVWATGEWSEIGQGKNGEPIPVKGYWFNLYVPEGDDWKCRVDVWNVTPTPAATASPTASPSNQ